jgi:hypothetical protein
MVVTPHHTARSLINIHGADALEIAEHTADGLRRLGRTKRLDEWIQVIAEIKRIQSASLAGKP